MKGIYRIKNKLTGKVYIGNTNSYEEIKILKVGLHDNEILQRDFNSFKENNFIVEPVIDDIPESEDIGNITEEVILHENPYYNQFTVKEKIEIQEVNSSISYENSSFVSQVKHDIKEMIKQSVVSQSRVKGMTPAKMSKMLNGTQCITLEDIKIIADNCNKKPKIIFE